jgi:hypothetical protein
METLQFRVRGNQLKDPKPQRGDTHTHTQRQHGHLVMKSIPSFVEIGQLFHTLKEGTQICYLSLKRDSRPGSRV